MERFIPRASNIAMTVFIIYKAQRRGSGAPRRLCRFPSKKNGEKGALRSPVE
jgi:hypothetical protein